MKRIKILVYRIHCIFQALKLWRDMLYGDISNYLGYPGYLSSYEAWEISKIVWLEP